MVVFQHEHPLTLIDLNPKYPHNEEVYDDEKDLIIKEAFQHPCDLCNQEIIYLHRYYYKCDQCDYSLHKLCVELPKTLEHASHIAHTLTLFLDESHTLCHLCKSIPQYKQLRYQCSLCLFNICLNCGMHSLQCHAIYHPSHQHPLIPTSRQIIAECDACEKEHKGVFYHCTKCSLSFIHNSCVFRPKRFLIQNGTEARFFHTHPLILTYSFPKVNQEAKQNPRCRVCNNFFSDSENLWVYKCDKCRYYTHFDCAFLGGKHSESYERGAVDISSSEIYEEDPNVLHLPLSDKTYNMIKDVVYKETNEMSITHNSHEHPLVLVDSGCNDITSTLCNACVLPILKNMTFYKCADRCNFVLHDCCTRLPVELKDFKVHPEHTLLLLPKVDNKFLGMFWCRVCCRYCNGFAYSCVKCSYYIDVRCAFMTKKITHKCHPYHRLSRKNATNVKDYCRLCLSNICDTSYSDRTSLSCKSCNFHIHIGCAFLLPETIKVKYDKHPMTLNYGPVENHDGDYFCEVCEEELNPNACFYHCHECMQSIHTACAPLIPSSKAYMYGGLRVPTWNLKYGDVYKLDDHPHPLLLLYCTESDGYRECSKCHNDIEIQTPNIIFKCLECKFVSHLLCMSSYRCY